LIAAAVVAVVLVVAVAAVLMCGLKGGGVGLLHIGCGALRLLLLCWRL
jgi:hypothetical protein